MDEKWNREKVYVSTISLSKVLFKGSNTRHSNVLKKYFKFYLLEKGDLSWFGFTLPSNLSCFPLLVIS